MQVPYPYPYQYVQPQNQRHPSPYASTSAMSLPPSNMSTIPNPQVPQTRMPVPSDFLPNAHLYPPWKSPFPPVMEHNRPFYLATLSANGLLLPGHSNSEGEPSMIVAPAQPAETQPPNAMPQPRGDGPPTTPPRDANARRQSVEESTQTLCPICLDPPVDTVSLDDCGHSYCQECLAGWIDSGRGLTPPVEVFKCPYCRRRINNFRKFGSEPVEPWFTPEQLHRRQMGNTN